MRSYPKVAAITDAAGSHDPTLLVPFVLELDGRRLSMFTTFGTPRDITLDELSVDLFFPADDETDRSLSAM